MTSSLNFVNGTQTGSTNAPRDRQAEQRRAHAMNKLIEILVAFGGSVKITVVAGVPVCQECVELRLGVPGVCLGVAG
jgi:hypothetical protein